MWIYCSDPVIPLLFHFCYSTTAVLVHTPPSYIGNFKDNPLTEFYWYSTLLLVNRDSHLAQIPVRDSLKAATLDSGGSPDTCTAVLSW